MGIISVAGDKVGGQPQADRGCGAGIGADSSRISAAWPIDGNVQSLPLFDQNFLDRYTLGDAGLRREILELFMDSLAGFMASLRTAENDGDWRHAAHSLKGSARSVGASRLGSVAERIESIEGPELRSQALAGVEAVAAETLHQIKA